MLGHISASIFLQQKEKKTLITFYQHTSKSITQNIIINNTNFIYSWTKCDSFCPLFAFSTFKLIIRQFLAFWGAKKWHTFFSTTPYRAPHKLFQWNNIFIFFFQSLQGDKNSYKHKQKWRRHTPLLYSKKKHVAVIQWQTPTLIITFLYMHYCWAREREHIRMRYLISIYSGL